MELEETLEILRTEAEARRRKNRKLTAVIIGLIGLQAAGLGYMIGSGSETLTGAIVSLAPAITLIGAAFGFSPREKSALLQAAESGDPRLIGHLFEATAAGDQALTQQAMHTLTLLLPKVGEGSGTLDHVQHNAMLQTLPLGTEPYRLAVARALPFIGRPESIAVLERMTAEKKGSGQLQATAHQALGDLRLRIAKGIVEKASQEADEHRARLERRLGTPVPLEDPSPSVETASDRSQAG